MASIPARGRRRRRGGLGPLDAAAGLGRRRSNRVGLEAADSCASPPPLALSVSCSVRIGGKERERTGRGKGRNVDYLFKKKWRKEKKPA
jgi:hypothetical protein